MKKPKWRNARTRKRCPVCYVHKTYAGPICPSCTRVGYAVQMNGKIRRQVSAAKD